MKTNEMKCTEVYVIEIDNDDLTPYTYDWTLRVEEAKAYQEGLEQALGSQRLENELSLPRETFLTCFKHGIKPPICFFSFFFSECLCQVSESQDFLPPPHIQC